MKKLIGSVAVAAMLATAAFAEGFTFGTWNRALWVFGNDDGEVKSNLHQSWGGDSRFGSLNISVDSEHAGAKFDIHFNGYRPGAGDNAQLWIKPIEQIMLIFGKTDQNYFRGDNCLALWDWDRFGALGVGQEGFTFDEMEAYGVGLKITPIDGLLIFGAVDVGLDASDISLASSQFGNKSRLGVSYTIADVGTIKVGAFAKGEQYDKDGDSKHRVDLEAAFDLTAVDGLFVSLGAKIPLGGTYSEAKIEDLVVGYGSEPVQVNLGVGLYFVENLGIQFNFGTKINSYDLNPKDPEEKGKFGFLLQLGVDYTFAETWKVFAGVAYGNGIYMNGSSADNKDSLAFGVGIDKAFSNGSLGIAFQAATNNGHSGKGHGFNAKDADKMSIAVPIKMQIGF